MRRILSTLVVLGSMVVLAVRPAAGAEAVPKAEPAAQAGPATASSVPAPVSLASITALGVKGNDNSLDPDISSSGQRVAFDSRADNLAAGGDTNLGDDIFVKDLTTGDLFLASSSDPGTIGDDFSVGPSIGAAGTRVGFYSAATNLDPGDVDALYDVYVKVLDTGNIILASTSDVGVKGNGYSLAPSLARLGKKLAFYSTSTNLDPLDVDLTADIYLKNLATGDIRLVSTSTGGTKGNGYSSEPSLASNVDVVAFASLATNLDPADADSISDIFVKDLTTGTLTLASTSDAGVKGSNSSIHASISSGGRWVAFESTSDNLDPSDADIDADIYVKDLTAGDLVLVSTSDDGVKGNGRSFQPSISGDGRRVAFYSESTNLDPADTDTEADVYVKDLATGDIVLASTSEDGVKGDARSATASLSGKGKYVAFQSEAANLDPADTDNVIDIFRKEPLICTRVGTAGNDVLNGTSGPDVLCGRGGSDTISGRGNADVLLGEGGADTLVGGAGADALDGGDDVDTADYSASAARVVVYLTNVVSGAGGDADGDTVYGMENLTGSAFDDELYGDAGVNVLTGGAGIDILAGIEGTDTLQGEGGNDFLIGGPDGDVIDGGADFDTATYSESPVGVNANLTVGTGTAGNAAGDTFTSVEALVGSQYNDKLKGDAGDNTLEGNDGDDTLTGLAGTDTFDGGPGTNTCDDVAGETAVNCEI